MPVKKKRLGKVFAEILKERGVENLSIAMKQVLRANDALQKAALLVALGKACVCKAGTAKQIPTLNLEKNVITKSSRYEAIFLSSKKVSEKDEIILAKDQLLKKTEEENYPYIAIDCRFLDTHTEKEKRKLFLQIKQTLGVVRKYMWDDMLIVACENEVPLKNYSSLESFLEEKGLKKIILLDPNGEELFSETEEAECYIIGGIVDKTGDKKGLTSRIGEELKSKGFKVKSRRIELRGDVIGVPDRINHIAEIILKVIFEGKDVEKAILEVQPPIVARWRLRKELPKHCKKVCLNGELVKAIDESVFYELKKWLNIRKEDFEKVCKEIGAKIIEKSDEKNNTSS